MNLVIISGRLVREPEVRNTGEMGVAKYTLAVDRNNAKKDAESQTDFINCTAFGKNADFAEKYLHKGTKILITGHWQTGSFTNKDGQKVYTNECVTDRVEFCESKSAQNQGGADYKPNFGTPEADLPISGNQFAMPQPTQMAMEGFMNVPTGDTELPFGKITP